MTVPFTELRDVTVLARTGIGAAGPPLWTAQLVVGLLNRLEEQDDPQGPARDAFRAAVRLVAHDTDATAIVVNQVSKSGYHAPRLIQAAVRAHSKIDGGGVSSLLTVYGGIATAGLDPHLPSSAVPPYSDVLLGLNDTIASKDGREIELPKLTLEAGAIATLLRIDSSNLAKWLGIPSGSPKRIFGATSNISIATITIGRARYLPVWLVPEGIELDANLPDPFADPGTAPAALQLRLLLTYDAGLSEFTLRPRAAGPVKADADTLRASFDSLMGEFGGSGTPLLAEVEPKGLPFAWSLGQGTGGSPLDATKRLIYIDRNAIRVRLNSEAPDGSAIPTVCQLKVRSAQIATADRQLSISCDSSAHVPDLAVAAAPADNLVTATVSWVGADPGGTSIQAGKNAPQVIDTGEFEKRLRERYDAAGLQVDPRKPLYLFLPLERGMVQVPLAVPPSPEDKKSAQPDGTNRSAFSGLIRSRMPMGDNRDAALVEVTAAIGVEIVVTLAGTPTTTRTTAMFTGARGTATGLVFAAAASPSPTSVLPPLETGPIACEPLEIVFGNPQTSSTLSIRTWDIATVSGHPTRLSIAIVLSAEAGDAIVWRPHPRMALVSTMPMTRTRFDATRPSTTRDLVPFTVASGKAREFALSTALDDPNRSPFPDLVSLPAASIESDPVWPWPMGRVDNSDIGEANDAIANVSASALTLPGIEMTLDAADWGKLRASLRYDLPILGELFASATLPKAPAPGSPQPDDVPEHAPTALEPKSLTGYWTLTANRHALSRTINDRATDWFTLGATPSTKRITTFVEPYSFIPNFTVAVDSAGLPLGAYGLFGTTVAGSSALAGWSGRLTSQQGVAVDIVGFSTRLYAGNAGGNDAQVDTRGIGQALLPRLPQGVIELRDITRLDTVDGAVQPTDRVSLTAAHIRFSFAGKDCGLRLRDVPMTADGHGNLSFAPTSVTADKSRALTGPEGDVGPDGSVFERRQLQDAVFEWSFYTRPDDTPSFLCRLAGLDLRPLRLTSVSFANEAAGLRLSGFEIIANVEPSTPLVVGGSPINDDDPYRTGNPVALTFTLSADGSVAKLDAVHPVSVKDRTILIGPANQAAVSFPATANLLYGAADALLADSSSPRTHDHLPIVLDMTLQASGEPKTPLAIGSSAVNAVLFGSPTKIPFDTARLVKADADTDADTLIFDYQSVAATPSLLQVPRVVLTWSSDGAQPTLKLCIRLQLPGAVVADALPTGSTRNLVDWHIGATLRWFGTTLPNDGSFNFDADHGKGTLELSVLVASLPEQAAFIQGWPIAGKPFTLALAMAFAPFKAPDLFPAGPSAGFVEATCGTAADVFIRHRSIAPSSIETRTSRILVSLPTLELTSAIAWPIDGLAATFPAPFAPDPRHAADWRQDIKVDGANAHAHKVALIVRDAELPALHLIESGGRVTLGAPWTFPALATHSLTGGSASVTWTSIDEIVVGHVSALEQEAVGTLDAPPGDLAFAARYRGSLPVGQEEFALSAGVFSKAMARAGIPSLELLIGLRLAQKARGAAAPAVASGLFISGAALIEVAVDDDNMLGHRVATPWIAPLFDPKALGVLSAIPQAPWNGQASSYDLAAYSATPLDRATVIPFATSDPSVTWIKRYRERIAPSLPGCQVPRFEPVSQAIIADANLPVDGNDPAPWLSRPIWLRTLTAWKAILAAAPKLPVADRAVTVMPMLVSNANRSLRATAVRLAVQRSVTDEPVGTDAVAASDLTWNSGIAFEVIVLTRAAVTVVAVANDDAKTLENSQQTMDGEERKRLAQLALSVPDEPLAAALGELTDVPADLLTEEQARARTHRVGGFLELPAYLDASRQTHRLRDRQRTLFPSAALAWPRAAVRARWDKKDQPAALALGDQRPLQDPDYAWAGDARSFSVTGVAAGAPDTAAPFGAASVLTIGQRALFRRPTDDDLTAPPDRALIPVPSRARVPNAQSIALGLQSLRLRMPDGMPEAAIAAIQPGHFEVVTTGRRPGVLFFQYDGLSFADGDQCFDADQPRFGRPADRGPVVFRQTRAPRSTAYPVTDDLARRRQTFIGSDYVVDDANHLMPFALAMGPMTALRILNNDDAKPAVETILLRLAGASAISSQWKGVLTLTATLYATRAETAAGRLAEIGPTTPGTRIGLVINGRRLDFPSAQPGAAVANPLFKPHGARGAFDVPILLKLAPADAALATSILQSADADSRATLIVSVPAPNATAACANKSTGDDSDLPPGPPRLLAISVPIAAGRGPTLRVDTATLAFGDPAYDREISSKTASDNQQVDGKPYLLALDRKEYDLSSSISFAAGAVLLTNLQNSPGRDPEWGATEVMKLQLGLLRKATPNVTEPSPMAVLRCNTVDFEDRPPQHRFCAGQAYTIALADLMEVVPNKKGDWKAKYTLQSPALVAGDRIVVTALWSGGSMAVTVTIVSDPVLSPPAAVYGLATLDQDQNGAKRLTSSLFATAPLPQIVEFQDFAGDLAKGLVRRRALFVWPFCPRTAPPSGKPYGALIKFDRTGGGQLPDNEADFQALLI